MIFPGKSLSTILMVLLLSVPLFGAVEEKDTNQEAVQDHMNIAQDGGGSWSIRTLYLPFHLVLEGIVRETELTPRYTNPMASDLAKTPLSITMESSDLEEILEYTCGAVGLDYGFSDKSLQLSPALELDKASDPALLLERSRELYRKALIRFTGSRWLDEAYFQLGRLDLKKGDFRSAAEQFTQIFNNFKQSARIPDSLFLCGKAYFFLEEWKKTRNYLRAFLNNHFNHPFTPNAYLYMAESLVRENREEDGIRYLDLLLKNFPEWECGPQVLLRKAALHIVSDDIRRAKETIATCRSKKHTLAQKRELMKLEIKILEREQNLPAMEEHLTALLHLKPTKAEAASIYGKLGKVFKDSGQQLRAVFCFQTLLHDYPQHADVSRALINMGECYLEVGLKSYAQEVFHRAGKLSLPREEAQIIALARGLSQSGDSREAYLLLEDAVDEQPHSGTLLLEFARHTFKAGRIETCLRLIRKSPDPIRLTPQWEALCILAGDCLYLLNRIDKAEKAYRGILSGGKS